MNPFNQRYRNNVIKSIILVICLAAGLMPSSVLSAEKLIHHSLSITLRPEEHRLLATDTITLPADQRNIRFLLQAGLNPFPIDPKAVLRKAGTSPGPVPLEAYTLALPPGTKTVSLGFGGTITPIHESKKDISDWTVGTIDERGVFLAGNTFWYPRFETPFVTFTLTVKLPATWDAVSQGARTLYKKTATSTEVRWESPDPQEEIYLCAARFTEYEKTKAGLTAMVYLRTPDQALAARYIDATFRYVPFYSRLIGPYPYSKFALVENFRETGLGMPSFTLLGPTVIRLPFIIDTSYPHEILHNWWGNSVYPVYEQGNWSEGLTAYLADHLLQEQKGKGADFRLNTLQKYADYVRAGKDFPLTDFISRHSPATEAVGYGKALMFFHMLRLELGDTAFLAGLRNFYRNKRFHFATFGDIEARLEKASGKDLKSEFRQWVVRTGAPQIELSGVSAIKTGKNYVITFTIEQVQQGDAYQLHVPVAVTMKNRKRAFQTVVAVNSRKTILSFAVPTRPLRLDVDPEFDVFRRLDPSETPPAISHVLGAKKILVLLPSAARKELLRAYEVFAKTLTESASDKVDVRFDRDMRDLPSDQALVILGWENAFIDRVRPGWSAYDVALTPPGISIAGIEISRNDHDIVIVTPNPGNRKTSVMFIAADRTTSLPGLARKLPHYHKYSYLGFEGDEPRNIAKGRWKVDASSMTAFLPDADGAISRVARGTLAARHALAPQ